MITARWKCLACGELQPDLTEMSVHMNEHVSCLKFVCLGCGLEFATRTSALAHTIVEDTASFRVESGGDPPSESFPFPCLCCKVVISTLAGLTQHIQQHYMLPE